MIKFIKDMDTESRVFCSFLIVVLFWMLCLNYVNQSNVAVTYNSLNGDVGFQTNSGWHFTTPFVRVSEIPTRPSRISLFSSNIILNDKIVKYVSTTNAMIELVRVEGFHYCYTHQTLTPYAYSGKKFSFLEIVEEYHSSEKSSK